MFGFQAGANILHEFGDIYNHLVIKIWIYEGEGELILPSFIFATCLTQNLVTDVPIHENSFKRLELS